MASDARVLLNSKSYLNSAYLSGYVVECSFKAVVLHDKSYRLSASGPLYDPHLLQQWQKTLAHKPYGHNLRQLSLFVVGPQGARYMPRVSRRAPILRWTERLRYSRNGFVHPNTARAYCRQAEQVLRSSIDAMFLDGVL
jgi:hypothetical protein